MDETSEKSALTRVSSDDKLIEMWLHNRPNGTVENYRRSVKEFRNFLQNKPLRLLTLEDLQLYQTHLGTLPLKDTTRRTKLNAIKSLFTFAAKLQYVQFNVPAALRLPKQSAILAGRRIKQVEIFKLMAAFECDRDAALFLLVYAIGARVSEACQLRWRDFEEQENGQWQVLIRGKGGKHRVVLVPESVWSELQKLRGSYGLDDPVFRSCRGNPIERTMAHKILKAALEKAKLPPEVSCHWLRHAHAQHSLAKGAPLPLVRDTLGHSSIAVTNVYLESNPADSSSKYLGL